MRITCCNKCTEREVGCHSKCNRYIKQKKELEQYNKIVRATNEYYGYVAERYWVDYKKKHSKRRIDRW